MPDTNSESFIDSQITPVTCLRDVMAKVMRWHFKQHDLWYITFDTSLLNIFTVCETLMPINSERSIFSFLCYRKEERASKYMYYFCNLRIFISHYKKMTICNKIIYRAFFRIITKIDIPRVMGMIASNEKSRFNWIKRHISHPASLTVKYRKWVVLYGWNLRNI